MWQRFTESARQVVYYAQEEARQQGICGVTPSHLLFGLFRESGTVAAHILDSLGINSEGIQAQAISTSWPPAPQNLAVPVIEVERMQLTEGSKRVIDAAYSEAKRLSNTYIGTEHLLLALVRNGSDAGGFFLDRGVTLENTRAEVARFQGIDLQNLPKTRNLWQRLFRKQSQI